MMPLLNIQRGCGISIKAYTDALAKCNLNVYEDFGQAGIGDRIAGFGTHKGAHPSERICLARDGQD
jgi:hypothetical protein